MAGLRERKKQRTRRALIQAALRLFQDKGYEETTIAEIAAEADVSTRTFFSYFASKEAVVLHDVPERMEHVLALVRTRQAGEPATDLLLRAVRSGLETALAEEDFDVEETRARLGLVMAVPALQAHCLLLLVDCQLRLARALQEEYPDELELTEAAAAVGSLIGAIEITALAGLTKGDSRSGIWRALHRAVDISFRGLRSLEPPADARPAQGRSAATPARCGRPHRG